MKKYFSYLPIALLLFSISCSEDDLSSFQQNNPEPEYDLFKIFDDYPALRSAFSPIDQRKFNSLLAESVNDHLTEMKDVLSVIDDLLSDPRKPVTDSISNLRNILFRIIHQDKIDIDPVFPAGDYCSDHAAGLYDLWDQISQKNIGISDNIIAIGRKVISYINDTYNSDEIEDIMSELIDFIRDDEPYLWRDNEQSLCEDMGKLFFRANENIWLDEYNRVITDRSKIISKGVKNTNVGNASRGLDALLSGLSGLLKDDALRDNLNTIMRDVGDIFAATVQGKNLKDVTREYIANVQKYLTPGGSEYEKWEEFVWPNFNPYSGYGNKNGVKTDNRERLYSDADLSITLKEVFPALQTLLIRADKKGSELYDFNGEKTYFIESLARHHRYVDANPDNPTNTYSHIEEAIYDHMRFDFSGKDRLSVDSYDPNNFDLSIEPNPVSNIDSILMFAAGGISMGFKDERMNTGEFLNDPSENHGNVCPSGIVSLSNVFTGLGLNYLLGINPFDIVFTEQTKDHFFRSVKYFDASERHKYRFNFDENYNLFGILSGPVPSDSGFPEGGQNPYDQNGEPILNAYKAYNGGGIGNTDFTGFLFGFIVRNLMIGEGPYYTTKRMVQDGSVYTYYRPTSQIYAHVIKHDPENALTWDYIYPAEKADTPAPAMFISTVDLITDGGATLEEDAAIEITIDDTTLKVVFDSGKWKQSAVVEHLNNAIDEAMGGENLNLVWPAGKGFLIKGQVIAPPDGRIVIKDISGSGLNDLFREDFNRRFKKHRDNITEYAGRENRYRRYWNSDYFMLEYTPFGSTKSLLATPSDMSGNASGPGSMVAREIIPEHSVDRECFTHEVAIARNFMFCYAEMQFSLPITLYVSIEPDVIKDVFEILLGGMSPIFEPTINLILNLLPDELFALPLTVAFQGNGFGSVMNIRFPRGSPENPSMGRWVKNGGYGQSQIPADFKLSLIFPEKILSDQIMGLLKFIGLEWIIDDVINSIIYGGNIMGVLPMESLIQDGLALSPSVLSNAQSIARIVFPRSETIQEYSIEGNNAIYSNEEDRIFGSRQGELLKDENGVIHPEWGCEVSDDDHNWPNRNGMGLIYIILLEVFRVHAHSDLSQYDPKYPMSAMTHNAISLHLDGLFGPIIRPPLLYFEKDTEDNIYPRNAWKPAVVGGELIPGHHLGPNYNIPGENMDPDWSDYFLTRTSDIGSSGINKNTGKPLEPDYGTVFGGWALKNFYRGKDVRHIVNILIDSAPFAPKPKRCDGLLPLLLHYDVTRYKTQDHSKQSNVRILGAVFRLLYNLSDPKYDDPDGHDSIDEEDYSTWGMRRKICYGLEQIITTIKVAKQFQVAQNENNYKRIVRPNWMFSEDENGNAYPMRPEDITFEVAKFPPPPENPDWTNFDRLLDALAELLSDRGKTGGKYNIMEDVIAIMEKIFTSVDASNDNLSGLRHTIGAILASYSETDKEWEYPDNIIHILEKELPEILEVFQGHYKNLLVLAEAFMKDNGRSDGFLTYLLKNLKSAYPTKDVIEQLYEFLGIDLVIYQNSSLWTDLTELLVSFVDMIEDEELPEWLEEDAFHSNKALQDIDPFGALGELLSW